MKKEKNGTATFDLSLKWNKVSKTYQQLFIQAAKSIELKGFRKGKAPLNLVKQSVDKSKLFNQVIEKLIPHQYALLIKKHNLEPLMDPKITPKELKEGSDWQFQVKTVEKPTVELGSYKTYIKKALKSVKPPKKTNKPEKPKISAKDKEAKAKNDKLKTIFDALLKNSKLDIAPLLLEEETKSALAKLINQLDSLKITIDDYAKSIKKSKDDLVKEYEKTASNNLKLEFILDALIQKDKPSVTKEEITKLKPAKHQENYAKYTLQKRKIVDNLLKL